MDCIKIKHAHSTVQKPILPSLYAVKPGINYNYVETRFSLKKIKIIK